MSTDIKSTGGKILYTADSAADVRTAVAEAVAAEADLTKANLTKANLYGANLTETNLYGANLYGANLYGANLTGANLTKANLYGANLTGANLTGADLTGADLYGADLYGANLTGADLTGADLYGANLTKADLYGANLTKADLTGANLTGAKNADLVIARTRILPDEGPVIGWKRARTKSGDGLLVKLQIPDGAKRSHASGRKCRAEQAEVLAITDRHGNPVEEAFSSYDKTFRYTVGATVVPSEPFCEDMWQECASGVHFFITRLEAEDCA